MTSKTGTRLGPYELLERIGAGGMGEIWLARDTNLVRDVAIKILPDSFASDASRVARFDGPYLADPDPFYHSYDVASDGRFLMIELSETSSTPSAVSQSDVVVVQNWFRELKQLVPVD